MSKKKNRKFKKSKNPQIEPNNQVVSSILEVERGTVSSDNEQSGQTDDINNEAENEEQKMAVKYAYLKPELRKLILILVMIIVLSFSFYILDIKSNIINSLGDWIYKISNFRI